MPSPLSPIKFGYYPGYPTFPTSMTAQPNMYSSPGPEYYYPTQQTPGYNYATSPVAPYSYSLPQSASPYSYSAPPAADQAAMVQAQALSQPVPQTTLPVGPDPATADLAPAPVKEGGHTFLGFLGGVVATGVTWLIWGRHKGVEVQANANFVGPNEQPLFTPKTVAGQDHPEFLLTKEGSLIPRADWKTVGETLQTPAEKFEAAKQNLEIAKGQHTAAQNHLAEFDSTGKGNAKVVGLIEKAQLAVKQAKAEERPLKQSELKAVERQRQEAELHLGLYRIGVEKAEEAFKVAEAADAAAKAAEKTEKPA